MTFGEAAGPINGGPILRQTFETVKAVQFALRVMQQLGPVSRGGSLKYPELHIKDITLGYLVANEIKQLLAGVNPMDSFIAFRMHPPPHLKKIEAPIQIIDHIGRQ